MPAPECLIALCGQENVERMGPMDRGMLRVQAVYNDVSWEKKALVNGMFSCGKRDQSSQGNSMLV